MGSFLKISYQPATGIGFLKNFHTSRVLLLGSKKSDFFCWPSKIKYPAVIYTTFLILSQGSIFAHKPSLPFRFFYETP
jgi:hypothetical protein